MCTNISAKPSVKVAALKPKKQGLPTYYLRKRWHPFFLSRVNRINRACRLALSVATGREFGLGITGPSANIMQFLVTGDGKFINWGVFLVLGILLIIHRC